jgi:hypothetical protein
MIVVRVVPGLQTSIDFTKSLSFESAPVAIFSHPIDSGRLPAPKDGPVSITAEFNIDPKRRTECIELMRDARLINFPDEPELFSNRDRKAPWSFSGWTNYSW